MIPEERTDIASMQAIRQGEQQFVTALCWLTPALAILGWLAFGMFFPTLLYLQPPNTLAATVNSPLGWIGGFSFAMIPWVWRFGMTMVAVDDQRFRGILSFSGILAMLLALNWALGQPKAEFVLEESVKARAPQLDFVRNIAFKQQLLRQPSIPTTVSNPRIALVGSSQINLGIDVEQLRESTDAAGVISACMPGMVPLQYLAIADRITQQHPTVVVCWLSEFDFFRERTLPTVRLRWCSDRKNVLAIASTLSGEQKFNNRGELADLALAAISPLWRQRSLIAMVAFRYWWPWNSGFEVVDQDEANVGAVLVDQQQGIENLRSNIARTEMVEPNFMAFAQFANQITASGARLIVVEGESHPDAMQVYPEAFRLETRARLIDLSDSIGFEFFNENQRPSFKASDWRDAVHLNAGGRDRLTRWVADRISNSIRENQTTEK